uniref:Uncharacterized protein n=1 Tax=Octopus bimaculoides TaxID=37653 RepID=A0A0L8H0G6_OCTBM
MISKLKKIPDFDETWKAEIGNIVADLSAQYEDQMRKTIAAMESKHALELQLMKANAKPREDVIAKRRDLRKEEGNKLGKIRDLETQVRNITSIN